MTDKHCESVNECANGELCAMLKNSAGLTLVGCSHFKPKQPMTNEEYLKSCNTEQFAEWIAKQKCDGCNDEPYDEKHGTCKYCMMKKTEQVRKWLKQPHKDKK